MYEQRRREVNKEFEKYQKQLRAAKKSGSKAAADKVEKGAKHKAKQKAKQQGGGGAGGGEAVVGEAPRQWNDYTVHFEFPEPTELPPPLLQLIDANFKYPGRDDFGMKNMNIGIDMGSRVAIVGPNGAGACGAAAAPPCHAPLRCPPFPRQRLPPLQLPSMCPSPSLPLRQIHADEPAGRRPDTHRGRAAAQPQAAGGALRSALCGRAPNGRNARGLPAGTFPRVG
jgi:hypothetical protein